MKRALMPFAALVTLATLTACSADGSSTATPPAPATTSPVDRTPSASPAAEEEPVTPVDGTWRAGPFPLSRVRDGLRAAGLASYFDQMDLVPGQDLEAEVVYDLKIQGDGLLMAVTYDGQALGVVDRQGVSVEGRQVRFVLAECASTFRWTANDDRLTLDLVKDTCPDYLGTPDAAYMTALYTVAPFGRV